MTAGPGNIAWSNSLTQQHSLVHEKQLRRKEVGFQHILNNLQLREGTTDHGAMSHHATHDGNQWTRQDAVLPCARMLAPGCPYEFFNSQ